MSRKSVKRIFIVTGLFLILQYAAVGVIGYYYSEPWPAFVFPGFKNVHDFKDGIEVSKFEFHFSKGDTHTVAVTPQNLFYEIPDSQLPGFLRTRFGKGSENLNLTRESRLWLTEQARQTAGFKPDRLIVVQLREFYSHHDQIATLDSVVVDKNLTIFLDVDI